MKVFFLLAFFAALLLQLATADAAANQARMDRRDTRVRKLADTDSDGESSEDRKDTRTGGDLSLRRQDAMDFSAIEPQQYYCPSSGSNCYGTCCPDACYHTPGDDCCGSYACLSPYYCCSRGCC